MYIIEILGFPLKPQPQNPFPSPIRASQPSGSVRRPAVGHWYGCCRESSLNQGSHGGGYSRSMDIIGYPICHLYPIIYYILLLLLMQWLSLLLLIQLLSLLYIYAWFYLFLYIYANYIKLFCNISASEYDIWICSWYTQRVKQNKWDTININIIIYIYTYSHNHTYNLIRPYTSIYDQWSWH